MRVDEQNVVLNDNGAWSWFMDERVIVHGDRLLVGSVRSEEGPGNGSIEIAVHDLNQGTTRIVVLHHGLEEDDHDGPAFHIRSDGRVLATWTMHSQERRMYWSVSDDEGCERWGPRQEMETPGEDHPPFGGDNTTYTNLHAFSAESGRLYNFFRSLQHQQNWMVSEDDGDTWRYGGMFMRGYDGYAPYFKYAGNGRDTLHFVGTEDHPRNYDNSVFHGYLRNSVVHHSDGTPFGPISHTPQKTGDIWDLTRVYAGDADHVAWVIDLHLDAHENPVCVFSVQRDGCGLPPGQGGMDHRYHYARWNGDRWQQHEIAYAGRRLYPGEDDYTGGAAIDPRNPAIVYISTDAHPKTGQPLISAADGQRHYELYRGKTSDGGASWIWTPLTADSEADHLRPLVPLHEEGDTPLVWMSGRYDGNRGPWRTQVVLRRLRVDA